MNNLIPKSLSKQAGIIYKKITWMDIILFILYLFFSIGISYGLIFISLLARFIFFIVIFILLLLTLQTNKKNNKKYYQNFYYFLKYKISSKKIKNSKLFKIYNTNSKNIISYKKDQKEYFIKCIKLDGIDITVLNTAEQEIKFTLLRELLNSTKIQFTFLKINNDNDFLLQINELKFKQNKTDDNNLKLKLQLTIDSLNKIKKNNKIDSKNIFIFFYDFDLNNLNKIINLWSYKLQNIGIDVEKIDNLETINAIKDIYFPYENKIKDDFEINKTIDFSKITFSNKYFEMNDVYYAIQTIIEYPLTNNNFWLMEIINLPATVLINFKNMEKIILKKMINKAIISAEMNVTNKQSKIDKYMQENQIEIIHDFARNIASGYDFVKQVNLFLISYGKSKKDIIEIKNINKETLEIGGYKVDNLNGRQFDALRKTIIRKNEILNDLVSEIPTSTLASGFPLVTSKLNDEKGVFLGKNILNEVIIFDQFKIGAKRTNSNQLIIGKSGSGKTFCCKKEIRHQINLGREVILIDPENEYEDLTTELNGKFFEISENKNFIINPLQIFHSLENNLTTEFLINNHLSLLEAWFKLTFNYLSKIQISYLIQKINQLYKWWGLYKKNDLTKLNNKDFPTFTNLLLFLTLIKKITPEMKETHFLISNSLKSEFGINGQYYRIWNGITNVNLNTNSFNVFNLQKLFEKNNSRIIQSQLFLILILIQNKIKNNWLTKKKKILIVIDEAHLLIDSENLVGLDFLYQLAKRIRKRNGGITLITQNPEDFTGTSQIRKKITAILNNMQYIKIFNLTPINIEDVNIMFKSYGGLTKIETNFLSTSEIGDLLFFVTSQNRYMLKVWDEKI